MRTIAKSLPLICLFAFFVIQFFFLSRVSQRFNFVDESEHLTPSWMMVKYHSQLYLDLSTNHQPLPILTAVPFWTFIPIANFFMLIERLRQYMFMLSFFGAFLLVLRFRWWGLIACLLIESIKYYFLGYHLLAESLVVYPTMLMAGLLVDNSSKRFDSLWWGLSVFLVAFNLLPTWPFLAIATVFFLIKQRTVATLIKVATAIAIPTLLLALFVSPLDWLRETVVNNLKYFLPYETHLTFKSYLALLIYPFLSFVSLPGIVANFYAGLLFVAGVASYFLLQYAKGKQKLLTILSLVTLYFLTVSLNLRIDSLRVSFYTAFHLLPQVAFFVMVAVGLVFKSKTYWLLPAFAILFFLSVTWWSEAMVTDKNNDQFINYGDESSLALALKAIKLPQSTLLAGYQSHLNVAAEIPLATSQTAYLPWGYKVPELKSAFHLILETQPPTYIYFSATDNPYFLAMQPILERKYSRVYRSFGSPTDLYVLTSEVDKISPQQWLRFSDLLYKPLVDK